MVRRLYGNVNVGETRKESLKKFWKHFYEISKKLSRNFKKVYKTFWKNFRNTSVKFLNYFGAILEKKNQTKYKKDHYIGFAESPWLREL